MKDMKPIIGLFVKDNENRIDDAEENVYVAAVEQSGGVALVLPYDKRDDVLEHFVSACDGFFFTGGTDINPLRYREKVKDTCGNIEYSRDEFEFRAFEKIKRTNKPVLGVCRGMQLINVALGGTLHQDIPTEIKTKILHRQAAPEFVSSHKVYVLENTPLFNLVEENQMTANSFHHQCIKTLGDGLLPMARADDGIIEAVYYDGKRYLRAYQWHPERLYFQSKENRLVFNDFINACQKVNDVNVESI